MQLIFLHGPAAVGKLTVARELAKLTGLRLFHNHLVVDAVGAVFDFGSDPFKLLREQIWLSVFIEAAKQDVSLIFTFAPERTVGPSFIRETIDVVEAAGGKVLFVELTAPVEEIERRLTDASRIKFGKLQSLELYRELSQSGAFVYPTLPDSGLSIDTSQMTPVEAAKKISEFFSLGKHETR
ncbi:MAG TPA: AAA family ATPase [Pyrinomonadaceae bacterium]